MDLWELEAQLAEQEEAQEQSADGEELSWSHVYCWGKASIVGEGQGSAEPILLPELELSRIKSCLIGGNDVIALSYAGTVYSWGRDHPKPTLLTFPDIDGKTPHIVDIFVEVAGKGAYSKHSFGAVDSNGIAYVWGQNGKFGFKQDGKSVGRVDFFRDLGVRIKQIAFGNRHTAYLSDGGVVYISGTCHYLSVGTSGDEAPLEIHGALSGKIVTQISCCCDSVGALTEDGDVYTWGNGRGHNGGNYCGHGDKISRGEPTQIKELSGIKRIASGYIHMMAIDSNGDVWGWGDGDSYRMGLGVCKHYNSPILLSHMKGKNVVALSLSRGNEIAITKSDEVWIWGTSGFGGHFNEKVPKKLNCAFDFLENARITSVNTGLENTAIVVKEPMKLTTVCLRYLCINIDTLPTHLFGQLPLDLKEKMAFFLKARRLLTQKRLDLLQLNEEYRKLITK